MSDMQGYSGAGISRRTIRGEGLFTLSVTVLLLLALCYARTGMADDTTTSTLNVTTNILNGTCEVSLANEGDASGGGSINTDLGTVTTATLSGGGVFALKKISVLLDGCTGSFSADYAPAIQVDGDVPDMSATGKYLFRGQSSTGEERIGIVLSTDENTGHTWNTGWMLLPGAPRALDMSSAGDPVNGYRKDLWVGVSCGDATRCAGEGTPLASADVSDAITFSLAYP